MIRLHGITIAAIAALIASACSQPQAEFEYPKPPAGEYPEWVYRGSGSFNQDGKPVIAGVGMVGGIKNMPLARDTAGNRARAEIAKILEVYSASLMKDYAASTNAGGESSEEQHIEQAIKTFAAATLQGVTVPDYWYAPDGTVYARAVLDFSLIPELARASELDAKVRDYVRDNAKKAFAGLEHEEACHKVPGAPPKPAVDILFVVDNSGSMMEEQTNIGRNFQNFFSAINGAGLDYQVGVVTTDVTTAITAGKLAGSVPVLTPKTPKLEETFAKAIAVGVYGSNVERGLEAMRLALSAPNIQSENKGFLRDGARLAVIVVSDEEDQSQLPVTQYTAFLSQLKGGLKKTTFAALVGGAGGCTSQNGNAQAGSRYIEAARTFGEYGIVESICQDDFASALQTISGEITEATAKCGR